MKKPRILHLLTSLAPGGAETNLLALMEHFDHDHYEHIVAYGGGALLTEYQKANVKLVPLAHGALSTRSFFRMRRIIRKISDCTPDIIHSHLDLPNVFGLMAKYWHGYKLVLHFHGHGMLPQSMLPGRAHNQWFWNIVARFYRNCDLAIAICAFQYPFLSKIGIDKKRVVLIPNGINLSSSPDPRTTRDGSRFRFVNVARFHPQKDHAFLIQAFSDVCKKYPKARLVLVGDGPLRTETEELAKSIGIADKVEFTGVRRDIPEIMATCDCFVLSSRWELHPITILEAMRASLPVVATRVGGVADTVADGISGILVVPGDRASLVQAMVAMVSNPDRSIAMGQEGRRIVEEKFSNAQIAKKIESMVYERLLDQVDH